MVPVLARLVVNHKKVTMMRHCSYNIIIIYYAVMYSVKVVKLVGMIIVIHEHDEQGL